MTTQLNNALKVNAYHTGVMLSCASLIGLALYHAHRLYHPERQVWKTLGDTVDNNIERYWYITGWIATACIPLAILVIIIGGIVT